MALCIGPKGASAHFIMKIRCSRIIRYFPLTPKLAVSPIRYSNAEADLFASSVIDRRLNCVSRPVDALRYVPLPTNVACRLPKSY